MRLSLVGYWDDSAKTGRPSEWPDPTQLVTRWDKDRKRSVLAYLRSAPAVAFAGGPSWCRFGCKESTGNAELWDGAFVWPQGLAHYVADHNVALPDTFLRYMASHRYVVPSVRRFDPERVRVSASEFLRWAASRAPRALPVDGAASLEDARARASALSTRKTRFRVEPFRGRWHITAAEFDAYVRPMRLDELDEFLAPHRLVTEPITPAEATAIASRLSGDDLKITFRAAKGSSAEPWWTVHEESSLTDSTGMEPRTDALGVELYVAMRRRVRERSVVRPLTLTEARRDLGSEFRIEQLSKRGRVLWRVIHPRKRFEIDRPDRKTWRSLQWVLRREARAVPMSARAAEKALRKHEHSARVRVARDGKWTVTSEHAEGLIAPVGDDGLHALIRDLKRAQSPAYAKMRLEVLTRRRGDS